MSKVSSNNHNNQNEHVERKTEVKVSPLNGCLITFLLIMLCAIAGEELKRSKVRLEMDKIKLEQMKKDTVTSHVKDGTVVLVQDTLKIGNYQKTYVPILKQFQNQKGN